jgi:hypothetical protein
MDQTSATGIKLCAGLKKQLVGNGQTTTGFVSLLRRFPPISFFGTGTCLSFFDKVRRAHVTPFSTTKECCGFFAAGDWLDCCSKSSWLRILAESGAFTSSLAEAAGSHLASRRIDFFESREAVHQSSNGYNNADKERVFHQSLGRWKQVETQQISYDV